MYNKEIINQTQEYVKATLKGETTGHDWWHTYMVLKNAKTIQKHEGGDIYVIELGSLLHDIADWKFNEEKAGSRTARLFLQSKEVPESIISHVCHIVDNVSFKGAQFENKIATLEGKIVQDADRLDAMGARGIARARTYGEHRGKEIYNPDIAPVMHQTSEEYRNHVGTIINHFYEKLLLLKDRMNTKTARKIAEGRHKFMELYLEQFFKEWEGKA
ncbi:phosphohydrolase [Euryarchaeota archaeon SM23-78]|nr:MAG: phosphohydrolase [Euryarchaeota archaeon SM23-78]MBW3001111.1 HD domain-containing protein [Candidatus Woesearchaeota archaeon]